MAAFILNSAGRSFSTAELPSQHMTSDLDDKQMELLRSILDDPTASKLDPFVQPVLPMNVDDWQVFGAEIVRGERMQHVGFLTWHGEGLTNSDAAKSAWKYSSVA